MKSTLPTRTKLLNKLRQIFTTPFVERILVEFSQGKKPDSFIGKLLPSHYLYKQPSMRTVRRNDLNFKLDISEFVDWYLYYGLKENAHETLYKLCRTDSIVFDIGTNNGAVLLQLSKCAASGHVYGFEPGSFNYSRCKTNLSINKFSNITVNNVGLGIAKGEAYLTVVDEHNLGMNKVRQSPDSLNENKITITTIDDFVRENYILKIDLIKIDTEGYELKVLLGGTNALQKWKPTLFIELDDNNLREQGQSAKELIQYLASLGYIINRADTGESISETTDFSNCHFDIIAD